MEESKQKTAKKAITKEKLQLRFIEYLLLNERTPTSVFAFCHSLKIKEADFYDHYNSFRALEGDIWKSWFDATLDILHKDEAYVQYSVREKLLAFYYTWIEVIKGNRSFVLMKFDRMPQKEINPEFFKPLHHAFKEYVNDLLLEGKDTAEIADRPFSKQYDKGFWIQFMFLTRFWAKDDSHGYEQTDAAIEKAVNFSFDLVSKGPLDSFLDLAKFLYQSNKI
ncbi:MAG: TetR family transcriptional regulator C-terminal domain-containing protein [Cytophagales bacterium]|nr:TetR family transcriptional regulator C-terminal domain-containing protein [Cytophagales bacterium]